MNAVSSPADPAQRSLVVDELSVTFGGLRALDGVTMSARGGEILGIIGPNGAGKTTIFNVVCGFVRAGSGTVRYGDVSLVGRRPHDLAGLGIARTLQGVGLFADLTIRENVMLGAHTTLRCDLGSALLGTWRSSREEQRLMRRADELLDQLGVASQRDARPGTVPYSVQKRTALARSLIAEPSLLLLDEPASGLSNDEMDDLAETIRSLRERMGVLVVEHHMDLVMSLCDRIVVLNFGQVIAEGSPSEIRGNPAVATAYLGGDVPPTQDGLDSSTAPPADPGPSPDA